MAYRILVADDEPGVRDLLRRALSIEPWEVETAGDGREALNRLCGSPFDLAVLDVRMPHPDGLEVLRTLREKGIQTDVIVLTGYGFTDMAVQAMKLGARDFVEKQKLNLPELVATVRRLLEGRHLPPHVLANRLDAFLKERAFDSSLRFGDLCDHFHLSASYVARLFQEHLGESFRRRLSRCRVQRAKELLTSTDGPLYLIAERCGFKHWTRLTEAFVRLEGIPPQKYREICGDRRTK